METSSAIELPLYVYDPRLERIDVGIRAVVRIAKKLPNGWRHICEEIGLDEEHRKLIRAAVKDVDNWRERENLVHLIRSCQFIVGFALELLRLYMDATKVSRRYHYARYPTVAHLH